MASLPKTEFRVGAHEYVTELMPAREALVMLPKIVNLLGRPVTTMLLTTPPDELESSMANGEMLAGILHQMSTNAVEQGDGLLLIHELTKRTICKTVVMANGTMAVPLHDAFDLHFAGELMDMFTVAMHVARASFTKPSAAK